MKTLLIVLLALSPLAVAQARDLNCSDGDRDHHSFCEMHETTIPAQAGISVEGGVNGGISVKGWDRNEILVRSQTRVWEEDPEAARRIASQIHMSTAGGHIRTDGPQGSWHHNGGWGVNFEIFVPRRTDLTLHTTNGGVEIAEVRGRMDFGTTNGGVKLTRVAGDIDGQTTNGGVSLELSGNHWEGEKCSLATTNGGVKVLLPADYSAHLDASTTHGGVNIDFPVTVHGRIGNHIETDLGSGGRTIRVSTTNGGISVHRI